MSVRSLCLATLLCLAAPTLAACSSSLDTDNPDTPDPGEPTPSSVVPYDMGSPEVTDLWVDPVAGDDGNPGTSKAKPLRTISAAWALIPAATELSGQGYRINLLPGSYPCEPGPEESNCVNYFDARWGTHAHPVILQAVGGRGTAVVRGGFNFKDVRYLYLIDVDAEGGGSLPTNSSGNNLLHLEGGDHVLLRGVTLTGPSCVEDTCNNLQEVLKVNQTQYLYVEESTVGGAWHSAVDYMVVQHGHVLGSHLYGAGQWCMYVKGGSAYLHVEGNEIEGCQLGFQAGQSANLAMMRSPWLHHEAYDVKLVNNVFHDLPGVPLSVAGAFNVVFAHNTLYRVATSPDGHPLFQIVQGERNCTATDELPDPAPVCQAHADEGGWGPVVLAEGVPVIPARNVWLYNNLFYNPPGSQTAYAHFNIVGPLDLPPDMANLPPSVAVDAGVVIAGNVIWNGPSDHPFGFEDGAGGCQDTNASCNRAQLVADNSVNVFEPALVDPEGGDYRPAPGGNVVKAKGKVIPDFSWAECPSTPTVPAGRLSNVVSVTRAGEDREGGGRPGAY